MREKFGEFGKFYQIAKLYLPNNYEIVTFTSYLNALSPNFFLPFLTFSPNILLAKLLSYYTVCEGHLSCNAGYVDY